MMRARRSVTIKHVAAEAGVSLQTVSRVINNAPNVSPAARERVDKAVAKLGYAPSLAARRMGGAKSYLLLALNDRDRTIEAWRAREGGDWIDQMLFGGMTACAEHGYRLMFELVDTHGTDVERELGRALAALRPDGVILTPPHSDNPMIVAILTGAGVRCARIGGLTPLDGAVVRMDDRAAAARAVDHLAALGHRRIGFIGGDPLYAIADERRRGFAEAVARAGLDDDHRLIVPGDFSHASGHRAARQLLELRHPPTAIIASSDQMALGVLDAARAKGVAVPAQLSVVSFDDTPIARTAAPALTSVSQPIAAMTACAARLLIDADRFAEAGSTPQMVEFDFSVRASTAPPA